MTFEYIYICMTQIIVRESIYIYKREFLSLLDVTHRITRHKIRLCEADTCHVSKTRCFI